MSILPHITFDSGKLPQHSIIWLHGLGADGEDFVPVAQQMELPLAVRYIFPHAPKQAVTINGGFVMRSWYDIRADQLNVQQDAEGIRASQAEIEKLIAQEKQRGVAAENIFLAGFSQGGAVVLQTGLRHAEKLGGILALSCYLPLAETFPAEQSNEANNTPLFMAHGRADPIVPYSLGKSSAKMLIEAGYQVDWHEYPMEHSVCMEEVSDIAAWLGQKLR
jgi:phospholipase/carboxylesterase